MSQSPTPEQYEGDPALRASLAQLESRVVTSGMHDEAILNSARAASQSIQARASVRSRWHLPASIAASFIVGVLLTVLLVPSQTSQLESPVMQAALTVPVGTIVRGAAGASSVPVEQAAAEQWYRYIQELIYSGDAQLAERHLRRFIELHPKYEHRP